MHLSKVVWLSAFALLVSCEAMQKPKLFDELELNDKGTDLEWFKTDKVAERSSSHKKDGKGKNKPKKPKKPKNKGGGSDDCSTKDSNGNIKCSKNKKRCGNGCIPNDANCCQTNDTSSFYCGEHHNCQKDKDGHAITCCLKLGVDCDDAKTGDTKVCDDSIGDRNVPVKVFAPLLGLFVAGFGMV